MTEGDVYRVFKEFMDYLDLYPRKISEFPTYSIDRLGNVYNSNGDRVMPYHYDGQYDSVYLKDETHHGKRDVHTIVAKTFNPDYYDGCVVHHIDENKYNNNASNLKIESRSEHARHHADPSALIAWGKTHVPVNKGLKASDEFREKCRISALKRVEREKANGTYKLPGDGIFHGNQYVNADGSKK